MQVCRLLCLPTVCFVSWSVVVADANPIRSGIRNDGNSSSTSVVVVGRPEPVSSVDDPFGGLEDIVEGLTADKDVGGGPFGPVPGHRESSVAGNSEYAGIVCRDRRGNVLSKAERDTVIDDNGRVSRILESKRTQRFRDGRTNTFVSKYSSTSVVGSSVPSSNPGRRFVEIPSDLKPFVDRGIGDEPAATVRFEDRHGNEVTQMKREKETVKGGDGIDQRVHALESAETKSLPNGYVKSFREHYSSHSVVNSDRPITCQDQYGNVFTLVKNKNVTGNNDNEDANTNNDKKKINK